MRNVADALGCKQASLYRHVRNREELVTLLADRVTGVASTPPPGDLDWAGKAAWSARLFRDHLRRHPGLVSVLHGTERLGPSSMAGMEYELELFARAGMSPRLAAASAFSLATFIIGSVQFNLGPDASDPVESRDRRVLYGSQDAAAFPLIVRHADVLAEVGSDDEFEVGLDALLAGFRDLIELGSGFGKHPWPESAKRTRRRRFTDVLSTRFLERCAAAAALRQRRLIEDIAQHRPAAAGHGYKAG